MLLKFTNSIFFLFLINCWGFSQISIVDKSAKPKINAIAYDGSFQNFNSKSSISDEQKAGVVGEKITLIDAFLYLKDEYGKDIDYSKKENFDNKTFTVIEYLNEFPSKLKIKNEMGTYLLEADGYGEYVFDKYIETVKTKFLNKIFIPLHLESSFESIDGKKLKILGSKEYKITNVSFSKLQTGYGIVFKVNDDFECIKDVDRYSELENDWVKFTGTGLLSVKLLERSAFKKFVTQNSSFIQDIRKEQIRVGMTENQCFWAFGLASRAYQSNGYKVQIYGDNYNSTYLYFKNGKLKFIKK